jgi:hypothetical protein
MASDITPGPLENLTPAPSPCQGEGDQRPDWIVELDRQCVLAKSQRIVAGKLGISIAAVSQLRRMQYPGDLAAMESRVRGVFMAGVVECPVLGELSSKDCQDWQRKPFAATNPLRVQLYRACRGGCPHSSLGGV